MCDMNMLCKTGTVCLRVTDPHFIFERICVHKIQTHIRLLLPEDIALVLNQVLSLCPIYLLTHLHSGGEM